MESMRSEKLSFPVFTNSTSESSMLLAMSVNIFSTPLEASMAALAYSLSPRMAPSLHSRLYWSFWYSTHFATSASLILASLKTCA